jgi:DNA polymerase-3 subunit gamma/tau
MENLVLYRKYRPRKFSEVVDQIHVIKTLTNAILLGKVAHAYLFCGPRGTGKTTVARIMAKAINCENRGKNFEPCNKCAACEEINEGRSMDLIEIDAASNRGIDEIRELREGIRFSPARLKYKVFIIDEAHMLTREAFNALLKTLEEPPSHAIFILATTEVHKMPQTIISRTQRFDFHKFILADIVERLKFIAKEEKVKIEQPALELIALNADGAIRDAESLLGQVMAMEDKEITLEEVQTILGTVDISSVVQMVDLILKKDAAGAIAFINKIVEEGYDLGQFTKSLINYLRKMMILKTAGKNEIERFRTLIAPEFTKEQLDTILDQGQKFSAGDLVKLLHLFIEAENQIKSAIFPQLPLELVVVELLNSAISDKR